MPSNSGRFQFILDGQNNRRLQLDSEEPAVRATQCLEWDFQGTKASLLEASARQYFLAGQDIDLGQSKVSVPDLQMKEEKSSKTWT